MPLSEIVSCYRNYLFQFHIDASLFFATLQKQKADNGELKQRNDALAAEVRDLKEPTSGGAAIEERARDEFGLIKPGETFYRVVDDRPKAPPEPLPEQAAEE